MPGVYDHAELPVARDYATKHVAFRIWDSVGAPNYLSFVALYPACTFPCRRFAEYLHGHARLGANAGRYSFIVRDFHLVLLAGPPAHPKIRPIILGRLPPPK